MEELFCKKNKFIKLFKNYLKYADSKDIKLFVTFLDFLNDKYKENKLIDIIKTNINSYNTLLSVIVDATIECNNDNIYNSLIIFFEY